MKVRIVGGWCLIFAFLLTSTSIGQTKIFAANDTSTIRRYQLITGEGLASRLYFLASDFFEGRETGTRGQRLAAHYLASQYRQLGLTPKGTGPASDPLSPSPFFQPFTLYRRTPKQSRLEVTVNGQTIASSNFSADS